MNFDSAIRSLSDGKAAKPASWGGFIYRTDITDGIEEFSTDMSKTYKVGSLVTYLYTTYVCKTACSGGMWDPDCWEKTAKYKITFRKRQNVDGAPVDVSYMYTPVYENGSVEYKITPCDNGSLGSDGMIPLDGGLLMAFQSQEWSVGEFAGYEEARIGTENIW